jgi:CRP-like cAMP-binding protein
MKVQRLDLDQGCFAATGLFEYVRAQSNPLKSPFKKTRGTRSMEGAEQTRMRASIRQFPLFGELDNSQLDFLAAGARLEDLTRGDILCDSRAESAGLYGLLEGRLKLALLSRGGREHVFDILLPGRCFGEYTMHSGAPCPLYAEALIRSEVLYLNRDHVQSALRRWPELSRNLVDALTDDLHRLLDNLATCCLQSATQRVAHYLLSEVETANRLNRRGTVRLPVCKAIVACSLDLSAETFSRELHQFEKDGLLAVNRRTIQIFDIKKLQQLAF